METTFITIHGEYFNHFVILSLLIGNFQTFPLTPEYSTSHRLWKIF